MRRRLAVLVPVLLLVLALVGDQVARVAVERRVGARLADRGVTAVSVHAAGWPFLLRLATGSVDATIRAEVPFDVLAHALDGTDDGGSGGSDGEDGTAGTDAGGSDGTNGGSDDPTSPDSPSGPLSRVTWSGENGQLVASLESGIALVLDVRVEDGLVHVEPVSVLVRGLQLPVDVVRARAPERFGTLLEPRTVDPAALGRLPAGTRVADVAVASDGLLVTLTAHQPER